MQYRVIIILLGLISLGYQGVAGPFDLVPLPASVVKGEGSFSVDRATVIRHDAALAQEAAMAVKMLEPVLGYMLRTEVAGTPSDSGVIRLQLNQPKDRLTGTEGYLLKITPQKVLISANTAAGVFYGIQTLWQMAGESPRALPAAVINDYPRFPYRGVHVDVVRHFMPFESLFPLIDQMAAHKLNVFHWHLVDDQGWRLEIKKYPKLTEVGAWRVDHENLHWNSRPLQQPGEKATYGGFYTQEQVGQLVKYAQERHITVIPEIEMPAHAMAALAAYPELSCTGQNLGVPPGGVWPITHIFCAGKEETFHFLEDVLTETIELFPSTIIHVGGDEADKTEWKKCPLCQKRIKEEGLSNEHELQSYFITRIEKFLNQHNRKLLGWDEILEGGLAPEASVMSWRGEEGAIAAAQSGHYAVMTPTSHCYFDYYQGDPALEPLAFGGNVTLRKVYGFEPVPAALTEAESKYILGAQANHWTEFILTPDHLQYMMFPRLAALAEVVWSPKDNRNWDDFSSRMQAQYTRYEKAGIRYARSAFQVKAQPRLIPETKTLEVAFTTEASHPEIRYTLDGSDPTPASPLYTEPVALNRSVTTKAAVFIDGKSVTAPLSRPFFLHKAVACPVTLKFPNSSRYDGSGVYTLVDGVKGSTNFNDGHWKGFYKDDMVATIDLGQPVSIRSVTTDAVQDVGSWIFMPTEVVVEVSADGQNFRKLGAVTHKIPVMAAEKSTHDFLVKKSAQNVRYVRVTARNLGVCPAGHSGAGQGAHLFVSEIIVN
jgi:hexosaminidase